MNIRPPAVAGTFYPAQTDILNSLMMSMQRDVQNELNFDLSVVDIIGGIVPHAGYAYSGLEAMFFFELLSNYHKPFDTVIILHPNHHGLGPEYSVDENEAWETPMGIVELDTDMIDALAFPISKLAHRSEHAGEVIVPFLQRSLRYPFKIIPISILRQDLETARTIAGRILEMNEILERDMLLIASSDFSHYVPPAIGKSKDLKLIDYILSLKIQKFYRKVEETHATICGCGPIMALMEYFIQVSDAPQVELLKFGNSNKFQSADSVVDYASILFYDQH